MRPRYISLDPLILWRQAERPIDWPQRFGRDAPLEVEIGFGNGAFLVRQARTHPERNLVGIELEWASVRRALRKIARANVGNVRLIQADARMALAWLFAPRSVHRVYSLFPCPWPKKRHAKHRLFSHAFLQLLNSRLTTDGEALIVTDHRPYLDWLLAQLPNTGFRAHWEAIPPRFGTKYERKWQRAGQEQFYELRLIKHAHRDVPPKEEIALRIHRVAHFDPDRFRPAGSRGDVAVEFKEFLYDPRRQKGMARVFVAEGELKQEFWIAIVWDGEAWVVRPAQGCGVVPTAGVQRALDLARDAALRS